MARTRRVTNSTSPLTARPLIHAAPPATARKKQLISDSENRKAKTASRGTIRPWGLRLVVALGVATGITLGAFRIVTGASLVLFVAVGYLIVTMGDRMGKSGGTNTLRYIRLDAEGRSLYAL